MKFKQTKHLAKRNVVSISVVDRAQSPFLRRYFERVTYQSGSRRWYEVTQYDSPFGEMSDNNGSEIKTLKRIYNENMIADLEWAYTYDALSEHRRKKAHDAVDTFYDDVARAGAMPPQTFQVTISD